MQLIDKSAVVVEIKKRIDDYWSDSENTMGIYPYALEEVIKYLDTLKVKEVDLEKEISDYLASYHLHIKDGGRVVFDNNDSPNFMCDIRHIAKWFFELGIKVAQKGE